MMGGPIILQGRVMEDILLGELLKDVFVILVAGLIAGAVCKRIGASLLVGYLIVGALIGAGGLGWLTQDHREIEFMARTGVLLLLFAIGMEFSVEELTRMARYFFVGGTVQMLAVAIPLFALLIVTGIVWKSALLIGFATALSSTVLVFKALAERGHLETPHGKRGIGILLFQDVALVPLMLVIPLLTHSTSTVNAMDFVFLGGKSILFVVGIAGLRFLVANYLVRMIMKLQSTELVVLFSLTILGLTVVSAHLIGLPPALGALAGGLVMAGNRMSGQVEAMLMPFRESFAAIFFVCLGSLLHPTVFFSEPLLLLAGLIGIVGLKTAAGAFALRLTGQSWRVALGVGLGLCQMGEFSFVLFSEGLSHGLISPEVYNRLLFIAMGTLIATPELLKYGLRWARVSSEHWEHLGDDVHQWPAAKQSAVVIGGGRLGRHAARNLHQRGLEVHLLDSSPAKLHAMAVEGVKTLSGDARNANVLRRVGAFSAGIAFVCISDDDLAIKTVEQIRDKNAACWIMCRCRYHDNINAIKKAGSQVVICDETEATDLLNQWLSKVNHPESPKPLLKPSAIFPPTELQSPVNESFTSQM
jgi:CPA2 family monovalent cation:H+ antiporter-2